MSRTRNLLGDTLASKVLAVLHPKEMPVYNARMENTLIAFGYPLGGKKSGGERYRDFCREAQRFAKQCGFSEVLSIDSFFEYSTHLREESQ